MKDTKKVVSGTKFSGLALDGFKLELQLKCGRLYTSRETFTEADASHKLSRLCKVGVHPVSLKQDFVFTGRQY